MISIKDYLPQMTAASLFRGISAEELLGVMTCIRAHTKRYEKGEIIFLQDDRILSVGVVLSGAVEMIREDIWGNRAMLLSMGPSELFGETFVCSGIHNKLVSFMAAERTVVLFVPFHQALTTCSQSCSFHRQLIENMVSAIAEKNLALMEKVDLISKKSLREKICQYLTRRSEQAGAMSFDIPLGRLQLAEYLHADRSALTRELNLMADEGLIVFHRNRFQILRQLL